MKYILYIFLVLIVLNSCEEADINWSPTFESQHKIPLGTYVMREEMDSLFPNITIENINKNTYDFFTNNSWLDEKKEDGNYIYINKELLQDSLLINTLDDFCKEGNIVFISSYQVPKFEELDSLKIIKPIDYKNDYQKIKDSLKVSYCISHPNISSDTIIFTRLTEPNYFVNIPKDATILGNVIFKGKSYPNFIQIPNKKGMIVLHAEPFVFTNYSLLYNKNAHKYAARCFSFVDDFKIYWDNERMLSRYLYGSNNGGIFNYFAFAWKHKALRYSILISLFAFLLFLIFNSSRRMRALPLKKSYKNESLVFAETMAKLYSNTNNYHSLIITRIGYFLEKARKKYYIDTTNLDNRFSEQLSRKSNISIDKCKLLTNYIQLSRNENFQSKQDYLRISELLALFES